MSRITAGGNVRSVSGRIPAAPPSRALQALADIYAGLIRWELWGSLGWHDIRQRYRRSVLGPFWITLSLGILVGALGFLYAGLFGQPIREYLPYLALGFIVWSLIASLILEGCSVFIASEGVIRQLRTPLSVFVYRTLWRNLLIFAHNIWIYVVVAIAFGIRPGPVALLALVGLALIAFNGIWAGLLLGLISARYRDIPLVLASVVQVLFFLTPILWKADQLPDRVYFVELNPFYHFVEIVRMPLLGQAPPLSSWLAAGAVTVLGSAVAFGFYARFRGRVAYWV